VFHTLFSLQRVAPDQSILLKGLTKNLFSLQRGAVGARPVYTFERTNNFFTFATKVAPYGARPVYTFERTNKNFTFATKVAPTTTAPNQSILLKGLTIFLFSSQRWRRKNQYNKKYQKILLLLYF